MAEVVGTAIGVVGLLAQLFDGCVKAYGYFTTAQQLDADSQRLLCKVRIEEMRLVVWGREWGVAEGKLERHLLGSHGGATMSTTNGHDRGPTRSFGEGNPQLRALAMQILEQLHTTVTDVGKLKEVYGLSDPTETKGKTTSTKNGTNSRSWKKDFTLKSRWVIADKDKFTTLLRDLKDFNDGLERLFPPSQLPSFQRAWTHQLLESAQRDVKQLSLLETASSETYPHLTNTANLKKLRINLDAAPQSTFKPTHALKVPREILSIPDIVSPRNLEGNRCHAHHDTTGDVLIEWVLYDPHALDERLAHLRRMDDLARMMHSASTRHPDLHSIDCIGYTDDALNSRYGLVYRAPSASSSSLHALISSSDLKTPDLDARVRLATTLAVATWSLHSLDWLHKSLCSSNVLFFPSIFSTAAHGATVASALAPDISNPYLTGFDASRPEIETALSVAPRNPSITNLHRHPCSLRGLPATKAYDVYSLGLVLLEIGLWKILQNYHKTHYSAERWRDKIVLPVLVPNLGAKMGPRYRDVVEMCLSVEEGTNSKEAGELMEVVVSRLESIRV
ncbi:prion-inhibition and propagation-domain-containing protein [Emericellopsis atlantica]|uniref:Prion-inhibition and propagation-domain-containing protein n=1 Tax=Emericellopsis atlantica TaxID=2614577 RepID=A0A9P8CSG5_9HYPO|nr:prion-inhibition and propagation-domain-containing protein [Emericellopsis atlantica]KAG9257803.1 prion-inhibition and propagation-domain-containing protein [Emericellopsis atlantica]